LLDHGYHIDHLVQELQSVSSNHDKIRFELSKKHSKQEEQGKSGFIPAIARWVVERSNAWVERCKILVKNYERTLGNAMTKSCSAVNGNVLSASDIRDRQMSSIDRDCYSVVGELLIVVLG
jgi:hypothetical protein